MNWMTFSPELLCFLSAMVFLGFALHRGPAPRACYLAALAMAALLVAVTLAAVRFEGRLFADAYRLDLFSQVFKVLLALGLFLVVSLCSELKGIDERRHPEFFLLLFVCTLAMMLLVSAVHLLAVYVALELSSYALYLLVALRRTGRSAVEAALKYFLIGICASAVMLFGLALLYGSTRAAHVDDIVRALPAVLNHPLAAIGLLLTLGGFFFKLAVFPFHFWAPDVYQGSANQVTAYIATASKVAAIAIIVRMTAAGSAAGAYLAHALAILSIVSMTVGNLAAIVQKDLKRLLAYSSIAQAGYVLVGILSLNASGYAAAIFYALALLMMKFTCFLVIIKVAGDGDNIALDGLAGLHRRSPLLAMTLMLAVFSLAGIPPTIGFTGKLLVFTAAMQQGHFILVLIAMVNVVISLYYYLLVVRAAYLLEPSEPLPAVTIGWPVKTLAGLLVALMVIGGLYPRVILDIAAAAAAALTL